MRALLVVNPRATTASRHTRDVVADALGSQLKLDVVETRGRGHAADLAAEARADGLDLVVVLGGDGSVNEVVNGLLADGGPGEDVPALALLPGGSTNVVHRALGVPTDPVEATGHLLQALRAGRRRRIGLGLADDRWFAVNAGLGIDAEVVRRVEGSRRRGRRATHPLFLRTATRTFYTGSRRRGPLTVTRPGRPPLEGVFTAFVQNARPWTFLGGRAVEASPAASFDAGLDVLCLRRFGTLTVLGALAQMIGTDHGPHGRGVVLDHDLPWLEVSADRLLALQVDGDYVGHARAVRLRAAPDALDVVC